VSKRPLKTATNKKKRLQRRIKFNRVPIRVLIPNIITLLALVSGLTAIRLGFDGRFELAVAAVILATVLDALDGQVARFLKGTSKFGAELDSLADFVNFGVVPGVLVYLWSLHVLNNLGWITILGFALCMAMRLARFNVALDDPDKPAWTAGYFSGIPAPAGAGLLLLPMYLSFLGLFEGAQIAKVMVFYSILVTVMLVSPVPTFSSKLIGNYVPRRMVLPGMVLVVLFAAVLVSYPWFVMTVLALVYIASIPFSIKRYGELMKRHKLDKGLEETL
jgi:CDP-diacylglycerol---serine O-phosphatidyltransferase